MHPFIRFLLTGSILLCLSGCTREVQVGPATVFMYALWVPAAVIVAGIGGTIWGVMIRRSIARERQMLEALPDLARGAASMTSSTGQRMAHRVQNLRYSLLGWWLLVFGPSFAVFYGPTLYAEKILVNQERFTIRSGLWLSPRAESAVFSALSGMELGAEFDSGNRERKREHLTVYYKKGEIRQFDVSDLMRHGALDRILEVAKGQQIPVTDNR
jgi:hypothetical protein